MGPASKRVTCEWDGCDDTFATDRNIRIHHAHKHGESLPPKMVEIECANCGDTAEKRPSSLVYKHTYCSQECHYSHRSDIPDWGSWSEKPKRTVACAWCGTERQVHQNYPKRERYYCDYECQGKWRSKYRSGENHPDWRGGWEQYYGPDWPKTRRAAWERDDYSCVVCGRGKEELGKHPDVHHITPVMDFDEPNDANTLDNVVTLCRKHHGKVEGWKLTPSNAVRNG